MLGFFLLAWISLVALLVAAPEISAQALRLPPGAPGAVPGAFLAALTAFLELLGAGVLRRWRWLFWLVAIAFLAGGLRVPVTVLELGGWLPAGVPGWYLVFQGGLGLLQLAIGLAMLVGYRRADVWGPSEAGAPGGAPAAGRRGRRSTGWPARAIVGHS